MRCFSKYRKRNRENIPSVSTDDILFAFLLSFFSKCDRSFERIKVSFERRMTFPRSCVLLLVGYVVASHWRASYSSMIQHKCVGLNVGTEPGKSDIVSDGSRDVEFGSDARVTPRNTLGRAILLAILLSQKRRGTGTNNRNANAGICVRRRPHTTGVQRQRCRRKSPRGYGGRSASPVHGLLVFLGSDRNVQLRQARRYEYSLAYTLCRFRRRSKRVRGRSRY